MSAVGSWLTVLFVPGDRPERFPKAAAAGADAVIIDWEDAVAAEDKAAARDATLAALAPGAHSASMRALVRINAIDDGGRGDLERLRTLTAFPGHGLIGVVVPKVESAELVAEVRAAIASELPLVALIESARGVREVDAIAAAPGVARLAFGAIDLALDLGASNGYEYLGYARSRIVIASRAAGKPAPLDSPSDHIQDLAAVRYAAQQARSYGFGGKLCIHPAQLGPVREGFSPSDDELEWARGIVGASEGASRVDGKMVDRPVVERARRLLELSETRSG